MRKLAASVLAAGLLVLLIQLPSYFAISHYLPAPQAVLAATFAGYVLILWMVAVHAPPMKVLGSWIVCAVFLAGLWAAIWRMYFYVKGLPSPPSSDTALMAPIEALQMGRGMYDLDGLINVPASPGPAWVLLNFPFTFAGQSIAYTFLTPAYVLLGWVMLRVAGHTVRFANTWMLLLFSGFISWELSLGGYDIPAMSVVVMVLYLLVERFSFGKLGWASILVAVAVGLFGTARVVFPYLAPLFGLLIWKHDRVHALVFTLTALAVTAGAHAAVYFQSEFYHPLHLFDRAGSRMGMAVIAAGAGATLAVLLAAFVLMKPNRESRLGWFTLGLGTPFAFIAFGELADNGWRFQGWEGGNYLVPVTATAILFILRRLDADGKPVTA